LEPAPPRPTNQPGKFEFDDPDRAEDLFILVYGELRTIAARHLQRERDGHTLQPTALVHEAWLRLLAGESLSVQGRSHFLRLVSRAMRQVLVDAARRRNAERRGGDMQRVTLDSDVVSDASHAWDVLGLHEALDRLRAEDTEMEQLVELRFFAGLTLDEAADALGISRRTAATRWAGARLWLRRELVKS
jgi:RNA polymerase sigma factor (TIGR02999 family)